METTASSLKLFFKSNLFRAHMFLSGLLFGAWIMSFFLEAVTQSVFLESLLVFLSLASLANLVISYFVYIQKFLELLTILMELLKDNESLHKEVRDLRSNLSVVKAMANDALARQVESEAILAEDAHRRELARARDTRYRENKKKRQLGLLTSPHKTELVAASLTERDRIADDVVLSLHEERQNVYNFASASATNTFSLSYDTVPLSLDEDIDEDSDEENSNDEEQEEAG